MVIFLTILHIAAAIIMILVVLLQAGKGAGMGAAFGGSSQAVFGASSGMTLLGKLTAGAAIVFMLTSMSLAYVASKTTSVTDSVHDETVPAPEKGAGAAGEPAEPGQDEGQIPPAPGGMTPPPAQGAPNQPIKINLGQPSGQPGAAQPIKIELGKPQAAPAAKPAEVPKAVPVPAAPPAAPKAGEPAQPKP